MIKRIHSSLNIFTRPYNRPSLSRDHQTVTIMNHCCYCFDVLGKMKTKHIGLFLNALVKLQNATGGPRHPTLMSNCPTYMPWPYQPTKWFVISLLQIVWEESWYEMYAVKRTQKYSEDSKILCILIMPHTHFRVNLYSAVAWMSRNSLLKTDATSEVWVTVMGLEPTTT